MGPRLEAEVETGLECQEITINSQNDCPFTEHKLYAQAQAGGEAAGLVMGTGGPGASTMDSGSSKARVGQGIGIWVSPGPPQNPTL